MQTLPLLGLLTCLLLVSVTLTQAGAIRRRQSDDVTADTLQTSAMQQPLLMMLRMQADVTSLQTKVSRLENSHGSSHNATSGAVAFTARISADRDRGGLGLSLGYQQTVVFNDVLTNVGNAYNNHTGLFTAPVDGTYVFFLTLMGVAKWNDPNSTDIYLVIVKNGVVLDTVYAHGGQSFIFQGSTQLTTQLRQGDHVWVRQNSGDAVRGYHWTVFTGYLLHAQ